MRVIQSTGFYYPESSGGTEVYVKDLAHALKPNGITCVIAAPSTSQGSTYTYDETEVFRYPVPGNWAYREVQGRVPPRYFNVFEGWLKQQRADIYHQHSWTSGCGVWHLKAAKRLGLKTVITVHVPANTCLRGTMLYEGRTACDGIIQLQKCAACWLQSKGLSQRAAGRFAAVPSGLGLLAQLPRVGPAFAAKTVVEGHKKQLLEMAAAADKVVAVCEWLRDAMIANGVPSVKVVVNRHGVGLQAPVARVDRSSESGAAFRIGFLGRYDPLKGIHVLVDAFRRLPAELPFELDLCGVSAGKEAERYRDEVQQLAAGDRRVRIRPAIAHADVSSFIASVDALAVPSQCLETGPLVVLEAFSEGRPVIGSDLGGIRELVSHERNGLLVPHDDVNAWTAALARLATDRALLQRLRQGIRPVRTTVDVAHDMAAIYREISTIGANAA